MHFEATGSASNFRIHVDGSPDIGGQGLGARPMELVLMALASCSSLDFVTILEKQRQTIADFSVDVDGTRREEIPNIFTNIHLRFTLTGEIDPDKANRAAELAVKKYCSVHDMLAAGGVEITYEVSINR